MCCAWGGLSPASYYGGPASAPVRFVVARVAGGTGFPPSTRVFPCHYHSTSPPHSSTRCCYQDNGRSLGTFQKAMLWAEKYFHLSLAGEGWKFVHHYKCICFWYLYLNFLAEKEQVSEGVLFVSPLQLLCQLISLCEILYDTRLEATRISAWCTCELVR